MKILALELSTKIGSIALLEDGLIKKEINWVEQFNDRRQPFEALDKFKSDWNSIDMYAVGRGPGSFSGLRVAFSVVNALALPKQNKIIAHNSAESIAYKFKSSKVLVVGDARRKQLWVGKFEKLKLIEEFQLIKYHELESFVDEKTIVVSSDYDRLSFLLDSYMKSESRNCSYPSANGLAKIVYKKIMNNEKLEEFEPLYLHPPVFIEPKFN